MKKVRILIILAFLISNFTNSQSKTDTLKPVWQWDDHFFLWKDMIAESDLIVLGEVLQDSTWCTQIKLIQVFKGKDIADTIWITVYPDWYVFPKRSGVQKKGEKYILFLNQVHRSDEEISFDEFYISKMEDSYMKYFVDAIKTKAAYAVWPNQIGKMTVKNDSVYCHVDDFFQYNYSESYTGFSEFIQEAVYYQESNKVNYDYVKKVLTQLDLSISDTSAKPYQSLMKLDICGSRSGYPVFTKVLKNTQPDSRYALSLHLREIKKDSALPLLKQMIEDSQIIIQATAVNEILQNENSTIIEPFLTRILDNSYRISKQKDSTSYGYRVSEMNKEIIVLLADLHYLPAIPRIRACLNNEDEEIFLAAVNALYQFREPDLDKYMIEHLRKGKIQDISEVCYTIERCKLDVYSELFAFIEKHETNVNILFYAARFLAKNKSKELEGFMISRLEKLAMKWDTMGVYNFTIIEYLIALRRIKSVNATNTFRKVIYAYYGLDSTYTKNPRLFTIKRQLETRLEDSASIFLKEQQYEVADIKAVVRILNTIELVEKRTTKPQYEYVLRADMKYDAKRNNTKVEIDSINNSVQRLLGNYLQIPDYRIETSSGITRFAYRCDNSNDTCTPLEIDYTILLYQYPMYLVSVPNQTDLAFLKAIQRNDFTKSSQPIFRSRDKKHLRRMIMEIEKAL
ncbi:hypothetical protein QNI16_03345 [Cytophagaceae bacterium YF14B1]|uniref:Uncharacterized protein n=1 Tax=Xanthocytophaga flava TaxID=3048013 RepID=A0AAE3QIK2_9BACT|nr:hypothetical protein [Xanthocytophaga flavus]MDJ1479505.1 hypothetical protein [Xanthocytophaga flavus]